MTDGGSHDLGRPSLSGNLRTALVFLAVAALVVPMAVVFAGFWSVSGVRATEVAAEQRGVRYLKPLVQFIGALSEAESAAVSGGSISSTELQSAAAELDAADQRDGAALRTRERWSGLRKGLTGVLVDKPSGHAAYDRYSALTTTALALVAKVGDSGGIATDRASEGNRALLRLPAVIVHSGQVVDLMSHTHGAKHDTRAGNAGREGTGGAGAGNAADRRHGGNDGDGDGHSRTERQTSPVDPAGVGGGAGTGNLYTVLDRVMLAREDIREGLRRSDGATVHDAAGVGAVDEFSSAVNELVKVTGPAASGGKASRTAAQAASGRVRSTSMVLADKMLASLDAQLAQRADDLSRQRFWTAVAMVVGVLLAAGLLWLALPGAEELPAHGRTSAVTAGEAPVDPTLRHRGWAVPEEAKPPEPAYREELLHVGRAVRPPREEFDDDRH